MSERPESEPQSDAQSDTAKPARKPDQMLSVRQVAVQIAAGAIGAGVITWLFTFGFLMLRLGSASCEINIDNLAESPLHVCREAIAGWPELLFGNLGPALGAALGVALFGALSKRRGSFLMALFAALLIFVGTQLLTGQAVIYPRALMLDAINIELDVHVARASLIAALAAYLGFLIPVPLRKSKATL